MLNSLGELSIRYHHLTTTSPNIVESLQLLVGSIALETIKAAGRANQGSRPAGSSHDVDRFLRWAAEVNICIRRGQFWPAVRLLQLMQETLINIFANSGQYLRAYPAFEAYADNTLKTKMDKTFPRYNLESIQEGSMGLLGIVEDDLGKLSHGQLHLTDAQRAVIGKVREKSILF